MGLGSAPAPHPIYSPPAVTAPGQWMGQKGEGEEENTGGVSLEEALPAPARRAQGEPRGQMPRGSATLLTPAPLEPSAPHHGDHRLPREGLCFPGWGGALGTENQGYSTHCVPN